MKQYKLRELTDAEYKEAFSIIGTYYTQPFEDYKRAVDDLLFNCFERPETYYIDVQHPSWQLFELYDYLKSINAFI